MKKDHPVQISDQLLHCVGTNKTKKSATFTYRQQRFTLLPGESLELEDDVIFTYLRPYKYTGVSLGFEAPRSISIRRTIGFDKGQPIFHKGSN